MSLPQDMLNVLKKVNSYPQCFYGKYSRFSMEMTMDGKLRIGISAALENNGGRPQKGVAMYNNDQIAFFTLTPSDAKAILVQLPFIKDNTYVNPSPKCKPEYKNVFSLQHFNNAKKVSSIFRLTNPKGEKNKLTVYIKSLEGKTATFQLSNNVEYNVYELFFFEKVLLDLTEHGVYDSLRFKAEMSIFRSALYELIKEATGGGNSGGGYTNNNNNYNNSGGNYNQQPQQQQYNNSGNYQEPYVENNNYSGPPEADQPMSMDDIDREFSGEPAPPQGHPVAATTGGQPDFQL